ncbi:MAG: sigma-70 family RNA polymerase sigma factor [Planctomycetaceae bacterium]|nr:sigma-70 family RNA polymerase sigma factor [Planctomycetaceae bacterium]
MSVEQPPEAENVRAEPPAATPGGGLGTSTPITTFDGLVGPLFRYARRLLGRADLAEDAVQETFLRLWQAPQQPGEGQLATWLFRVCRNWSLDVLRKDGRMSTLAPDENLASSADDDPTAAITQHDQLSAVRRSIERLPEQQQEVLRLRFDGQLSYAQIAEVTGLSVSHVGVILHQALTTLRVKFKPRDEGKQSS